MLSSHQQNDLETVTFFIPEGMKSVEITEQDITDFFEWSEKGLHTARLSVGAFNPSRHMNGLNALYQGKRWRGIHMEMWEDGILSGDVPYSILLEELPYPVLEFASREMFKGVDREVIMSYA